MSATHNWPSTKEPNEAVNETPTFTPSVWGRALKPALSWAACHEKLRSCRCNDTRIALNRRLVSGLSDKY